MVIFHQLSSKKSVKIVTWIEQNRITVDVTRSERTLVGINLKTHFFANCNVKLSRTLNLSGVNGVGEMLYHVLQT